MQTSRLRDRELQVSHSGKVLVGGWRGTTEGGSCFSSASFLSCLAEDPLPHCTSGSSVHWVPDLTHVIRSTISRQTNRRQATHGAFLWWGSMERPVGDGFSLVTPIPVNLCSTLMGLVTPSCPAVHRPWREGGSWPTGMNFGLVLSFSSESQKWLSNSKVFHDEGDKSQLQPSAIDRS